MCLVNTKNCALLQQFAGAFSRFLPTLPYPFIGGDNSPPISAHSPPAGVAMTNLPVTPTVLRPQPQLPPSAASMAAAAAAAAAGGGHMNNGATPSTLSPLRIRVSSPNRINSDLTTLAHHQQQQQQHSLAVTTTMHQRTNGIIRIVGAGNTTTTATSGICVGPPPTLHRPFSPSPQPKDVSWYG